MTLLHSLASATLIMTPLILLFLLLTPLLDRKYAAGGRYALWILVMVGLCLPFVPFLPSPAIRIDVPIAAENPPEYMYAFDADILMEPEIAMGSASTTGKNASDASISGSRPAAQNARFRLSAADIPKTILIVWAAGVLLALAFQILTHLSFSRFAGRWSEPETDPGVVKMFNDECSRMNIREIIRLKRCKGIKAPMMLGFTKPAILLPYSHYDTEELTFILRHELIHYKRRDLWYKLALAVIKSVYWFNPAVHLMATQANKDIETVCDVLTVSGMNIDLRKRYSEIILGMASGPYVCPSRLTTWFLGDKNMLKQRFSNIFGSAKKRGAALFAAMGAVVIVSVFFVGFNFALNPLELYGEVNPASGIATEDAKAAAAVNSALKALGGADKIGGIDSIVIKGKMIRAIFSSSTNSPTPGVMMKTDTFTYDTEIRILLPDNFIQINTYPAGNRGPFNMFPPSEVSTTAYEGVSQGMSLAPPQPIGSINGVAQWPDEAAQAKRQADEAINQINEWSRFLIGMFAKSGPAPLTLSAGSTPNVFAIGKTGEDFGEIEFDSKTGYPSVVRFNTPGPPNTSSAMTSSVDPETGKTLYSFDSRNMSPPDMVVADIQFKDRFSVDGIMFPRVVRWQIPGRRDMELWIQEVQINPNLSLEDFEVPE